MPLSQEGVQLLDLSATQRTIWKRVNATTRPIAILGLASLASGVLVGGVGGRVVMGISARAAGTDVFGRLTENGNVVGEFTIGGTIALVLFVGLLGGMAGSVGIVASDPWLRWLGPLQGFGFGMVVMSVYGYETFTSIDFRILDPLLLNVIMFLGLFLAFGVGVVGFRRVLDSRLPRATDGEQIGWLLVVGLGTLPLAISLLFFTSSSFCGCEPATEIGLALLLMILSTMVYHMSNVTAAIPKWSVRLAIVTGYASTAAAVAFGLNRIVEDLQRLF